MAYVDLDRNFYGSGTARFRPSKTTVLPCNCSFDPEVELLGTFALDWFKCPEDGVSGRQPGKSVRGGLHQSNAVG